MFVLIPCPNFVPHTPLDRFHKIGARLKLHCILHCVSFLTESLPIPARRNWSVFLLALNFIFSGNEFGIEKHCGRPLPRGLRRGYEVWVKGSVKPSVSCTCVRYWSNQRLQDRCSFFTNSTSSQFFEICKSFTAFISCVFKGKKLPGEKKNWQ